jgi:hypothetical protein
VSNKRRELGIDFKNPKYQTWDPAYDKLIGAVRDEEIAKRTGLPVNKVRNRRHRLGIPIAQPQKRRWTAEEEALLGTAPDAEVAAKLDRSENSVHVRRSQLGISSVPAPSPPRQGDPGYRPWHSQNDHLLGVLRDEEVARQTGCRVQTVRVRRHKLNIPIAQSQRRPWTPRKSPPQRGPKGNPVTPVGPSVSVDQTGGHSVRAIFRAPPSIPEGYAQARNMVFHKAAGHVASCRHDENTQSQ